MMIAPNNERTKTEWGIGKGIASPDSKRLDESVLENCFREMCLLKSSLDLGPGGHGNDWMTARAKKWFSNQHDGNAKLSKNQFSRGLSAMLSVS